MSQVENLMIYFVLRTDDDDEGDSSDDMKLAYNTVLQYGATAKWIKPSSCPHVSSSKDVFVFDKFEGDAFKELKKQSAKILGARCMLTCLSNGRSIPNGHSPVFTEGMRDLVVCCTGFDSAEKKKMQQKVEYMGGIFIRDLRGITTHLVAHNTISNKAIESYKYKLPIMKSEWIDAVWERSITSNVNGRDDEFNSFAAPLFHNVRITTSGIARKEKNKIKELIENNGGTFTGSLEESKTHVLIIAKPEGEKYKHAKLWNIVSVRPSWLYKCIATRSVIPFGDYILENTNPKSSTPNKGDDGNFTANFSMMSSIGQEPDRLLTHLEESNVTLSYDNAKLNLQTPKKLARAENYCDVIDNIYNNLIECGQFLDGCNIYACGFEPEYAEKMKKILNTGGAARFNELTEFVTHIIVGKQTDSIRAKLKNTSAHILSIDWLVESVKLKRPAPPNDFLIMNSACRSAEPPSPLSKLGAKLLRTMEDKTVEKPRFGLDKESDKLVQVEEELLNKYKDSHPGEPLAPRETPLSQRENQLSQRETPLSRSTNSSLQSKTNSTMPSEEIFKGFNFFVSSELISDERRGIEDIVIKRGGNVVGKRFLGVPDYAIVPVCGGSLSGMTTKEVVNIFFIKDCYLEESVVPLQYYHHPVACVKDAAPLKNCVISVSNYVQCEREFIETLIEMLGATLQSLLARKAKENILKSTHLICAEPSGPKYNGAKRWGLPVVHHDWLLKCAALGMRVSEQLYLLSDYKASTPNNKTKEPVPGHDASSSKCNEKAQEPPNPVDDNLPPSNVEPNQSLPASQLSSTKNLQNDAFRDSPVHSALSRLKNSEIRGNSPDVNRTLTPTSPYGAFYGNDNPSPGTRKRLWKWMNQGADFPQDPPMNYPSEPKKRDSTPLSTFLSKLLSEMKRKPEEIPTDSPIDGNKRCNLNWEVESSGRPGALDLNAAEDPSESRMDQDSLIANGLQKLKEIEENHAKGRVKAAEDPSESSMDQDSLIANGLQKMREIEENYAKNRVKVATPVTKRSSSGPEMLVVTESQPLTEVGWEDPDENEIALKKLQKHLKSNSGNTS